MEADVKTMLQKIVTRQLEGVMFHFDAMSLYALMQNCKMKLAHYYQFREENEALAMTSNRIISMWHEVITATDAKGRVKVDIPAEIPASKAERDEICGKLMKMWLTWEHETLELYKEAKEMMPDCCLWHKLCRNVEKEIKKIEKLMAR